MTDRFNGFFRLIVFAVVAVLLACAPASAQQPPSAAETAQGAVDSGVKAREEMTKGAESFNRSNYNDAIEHFKLAVALDPTLVNARIFLATAYAQMYVPGDDSPDNLKRANLAIDEFKKVANADPTNTGALKHISAIFFYTKRWAEAREYSLKAADADPADPENYYMAGVIDWTQAYTFRMETRSRITGLQPIDAITDPAACAKVRAHNAEMVEDGIRMFAKALQLRSNYEDAMAYINLMYRERADYECEDAAARAADLQSADDWVDKTLAAKKAKAENAGGRLEVEPASGSSGATGDWPALRLAPKESQKQLIHRVNPIYPALARQARIQGTVKLDLLISMEGEVLDVKLVSGHPMLAPAAIDAVKKWRYQPFLLNGQPVEIATQVQVNFTLTN